MGPGGENLTMILYIIFFNFYDVLFLQYLHILCTFGQA